MAELLIIDAAKGMAADKMSKNEKRETKEVSKDEDVLEELLGLYEAWEDHEDNEIATRYRADLGDLLEKYDALEDEEEEEEDVEY